MKTETCMYQTVLNQILDDEDYQNGIQWGFPRSGHPEGAISNHIKELEDNLNQMVVEHKGITNEDYHKLKILIHVHDAFKGHAKPRSPVTDSRNHASIAKTFLEKFIDDEDLLNMVHYHDESYHLYRKMKKTNQIDEERFQSLVENIKDWRLFLIFNIIDNCTEGKERDPIIWLLDQLKNRVDTEIDASWILKPNH